MPQQKFESLHRKNIGLSFFKNWQERLILISSDKVDLDVVTSRFSSGRVIPQNEVVYRNNQIFFFVFYSKTI